MAFRKGKARGGPSPEGDVTWVVLSRRSVLFLLSLVDFLFPFFFGEGFGEEEIEIPRLGSISPHFGAGKCPFGDKIGEDAEGGKTSSCHSPFELDAAE